MIGLNTIKFINSLKIKKNRELNQKAILEGYRLIYESINAGIKLDYLVVNENFQESLLNENSFKNLTIKYCSKNNFNKISDTKNSQGIIAIVVILIIIVVVIIISITIIVIAVIFIGLMSYLYLIDQRVKKLEK